MEVVIDYLSTKICVRYKTKCLNVKFFHMVKIIYEAEHWRNIFRVIVNANSIGQHVIQIKNEIIINTNASVKIIVTIKKNYSWNSSACIFENSKYLKHIANN